MHGTCVRRPFFIAVPMEVIYPMDDNQHVNIFLPLCVCITICVSAYCEQACFAMQNSGFCRVKGWFLRYKTVGFVVQKVFS